MKRSSTALFILGSAALAFVFLAGSGSKDTVAQASVFEPISSIQEVSISAESVDYSFRRISDTGPWNVHYGSSTLTLTTLESSRFNEFLDHIIVHYTDEDVEIPSSVEEELTAPVLEMKARYGGGKEQTLVAGGESHFKNSMYARTTKEKKIGLLSADVAKAVSDFMPRILSPSPFQSFGQENLSTVSISTSSMSFTMMQKEDTWSLSTLPGVPLSEKAITDFLGYFRSFGYSKILWTEDAEQVEVDGTVCVNKHHCVEIASYDQQGVLRGPDKSYAYVIDYKKHPLPRFNASQFIERLPFQTLPAIQQIDIQHGSRPAFSIQRNENEWYLDGTLADTRFVNGWLIKLHTIQALAYPAEGGNYVKGDVIQTLKLNDLHSFSVSKVQTLSRGDKRVGLVECSLSVCPFFVDSIQLRRIRAIRDMFVLPEEKPEAIAIND